VQRPVPDVERLVVDQQPDDLAVGDVDDGLPAIGVPVAGLGVGQRPDLVHGIEVGAGQPVRVPLVEIAAQADVPVGQREDRLALGEEIQVQFFLDEPPGLGPVRGLLDHRASLSDGPSWWRSSDTSLTTMSAPCALSSAAWPTRSTPTTRAKWPAWPAATPAWASSKTTACAAGTWSASAAARKVSGAGFPRKARSLATTPSIRTSNRPSMPADFSTS